MEFGFSFGANLGNRTETLKKAKQMLCDIPGVKVVAVSSLYETTPVDVKAEFQDMKFLNSAMIVESDHSAEQWLKELNRIEDALGRVRGEDRNQPRTIDLDLLFAGDQCICSGGLTVPHPRWAERQFVVEPLAEIIPDRILPNSDQSIAQILASLEKDEHFTRLDTDW